MMTDLNRYGNRSVPEMIRQMDELRQAIRAEGTSRVQEAWDQVEQHIDYAYQVDPGWQPIETAPKDAVVLLYRPTAAPWARIVIGGWNSDRSSSNPRPFWTHHAVISERISEVRRSQPTHWMPLPEPPAEGGE